MKTTISIIVFFACLTMNLPGQDIADDVYFKPSDSQNITPRALVKSSKPNYKNGAKEIIYLDSNSNKDLVVTNDSIYILGEMNDSIAVAENGDEEGYYLNDFKGSASDLEYAERIRRFHNPKFTIHISDPQYNDIYFLDDDYWNVYVDGSYAWVTPTWTNPFWDNYFWRPYSYSSWYWRNSWYSPYSYYSSWYGNPFYGGYYGNYYGGWGGYYGGLYGWGNHYYPYYNDYWNYNPYYWGGYSWSGGVTSRNKNYDEANRRKDYYSSTSRAGNLNTTRISGGSYSPVVTRTGVTSSIRGERGVDNSVTVNRPSANLSGRSTNGNTLVRSNNSRGSAITSGINTRTRTIYNTDTRISERSAFNNNTNVRVDGIRSGNTVPAVRSTTTAPATRNSVTNSSGSVVRYGTGTSAIRSYESSPSVRSSSSSAPVRSSGSSSNYTPSSSSSSSSYSNSRSSTPSYSAPSSSSSSSRSSGSSYSGGSSSSRSSSGSSGGRR